MKVTIRSADRGSSTATYWSGPMPRPIMWRASRLARTFNSR